MSNTLNLNDITGRIRQYVSQIKEKRGNSETASAKSVTADMTVFANDVRSNLHQLDGDSKFNIHSLTADNAPPIPSDYAAEAYGRLSASEEKHKVVIDIMHKNNRNFDVRA